MQWKCSFGHSWEATVSNLCGAPGEYCPFCNGSKTLPGFNDLATLFPEIALMADGWDPTQSAPRSGIKRGWKCSQGHRWEASPANFTHRAKGQCPFCTGRKALPGFNDLATEYPHVAAMADGWDPATVRPKSSSRRAWRCPEGHAWKTHVFHMTVSQSCPACNGRKLLPGVNDLATLAPEVVALVDGWGPTTVTYMSNQFRSWVCELGHSWKAKVCDVAGGGRCPYCSSRTVLAGFNDMATTHPELARYADGWDPTTVMAGSNKQLPWRCSLGHSFTRTPNNARRSQEPCTICSGKIALAGFNDLATLLPWVASLADGWDPSTVTPGSGVRRAWRCELGHVWAERVCNIASGCRCPVCSGNRIQEGFNDLDSLCPELAFYSHDWDPRTVSRHDPQPRAWRCDMGHSWSRSPQAQARAMKRQEPCPECAGASSPLERTVGRKFSAPDLEAMPALPPIPLSPAAYTAARRSLEDAINASLTIIGPAGTG